jgi:Trp operon repressor
MSTQHRINHWIEVLKSLKNLDEYNKQLELMAMELTEAECEEVLEVLEELKE